ncbi:cytochrome [Actinophytocola xinjiangensis]|uniref:Cytochrome n=1 Tax=Actinophytocola xinjiangensis TaxID=485602 RepID=A0A7Z0WLA5_9PSEU|nr:cytochrome P450 [Actinophytocola xinjiangensis]OLF09658.1 cytochrome [Actinophytocola xinjiangensis]
MRITGPSADGDTDLDAVRLYDPDFYATGEPHAVWAQMRRRGPAHLSTLPDGRYFWSVTRYHDVDNVLRDHTRFTSGRGTLLSVLGGTDPAGGKMMAASDPPVHTALRRPLSRVLSDRALRPHEPRIRAVVQRMLGPLLDGGVWDVAKAAAAFPMAFTGTLMGLPEEDWPRLARLTTSAVAPSDPGYRQTSRHSTLAAAHHDLFAYFSAQVRDRIRHPREDLVGSLVGLELDDRRLRHDEIVYNCYSLLLGANVTTPHAIASTILALIEHPGQWKRLLAEPSLTGSMIEEGLRWSSPASHFLRHAVHDLELHGRRILAGDAVVAWLGSANRDEEVFADPYRFDIARTPNRHVAFGLGPHYCVGAPLARIALRILFDVIVTSVEKFTIAGPIEHLASDFVAGIKSLPLTAQLSAAAARAIDATVTQHGPAS